MLDLVLKGKWYDMIESGEKRQEYRDATLFWLKRILKKGYYVISTDGNISSGTYKSKHNQVTFRRGYGKTAKRMCFWILCDEVFIRRNNYGRPEWQDGSFKTKSIIVINLGKRIS